MKSTEQTNILEKEACSLILHDRFSDAGKIIHKLPDSVFKRLFQHSLKHRVLLSDYTASIPRLTIIQNSDVCHARCKMCLSGFHNKSEINEGRYFLFEDFKKFSPGYAYAREAKGILLCGRGEPLLAPDTEEYLDAFSEKETSITSSGLPLNEEMMKMLIQKKLNYLYFSFDGRSSIGHGGGNVSYNNRFWKMINTFNSVKRRLKRSNPQFILNYTVTADNIESFEETMLKADKEGFFRAVISLVVPIIKETEEVIYRHSVFPHFKTLFPVLRKKKEELNKKLSMNIYYDGDKELYTSDSRCKALDQCILFTDSHNYAELCCGKLTPPLSLIRQDQPLSYINSFPFRYLRYLQSQSDEALLPLACYECVHIDVERCVNILNDQFNKKNNESKHKEGESLVYEGMAEKHKGNLHMAETLFKRAVTCLDGGEFKGRSAFHLCEIALEKGHISQALHFAQMSVRNCFSHLKAFTYLYLLMQEPCNGVSTTE